VKRQKLLFFGAVAVPSLVLAVAGMLTIRQETELSQKRAADEKLRIVGQDRRELEAALDGLRKRVLEGTAGLREREIGLIAALRGDRVIMPWEERPDAQQTFIPAGDSNKAIAAARRMLQLDPKITDEYGVPAGLYGARRLIQNGNAEDNHAIDSFVSNVLTSVWLSPAAAHMVLDVTQSPDVAAAVRERLREIEDGDHLHAEGPMLARLKPDAWIVVERPRWIVGVSDLPGQSERLIVAVRTAALNDLVPPPKNGRWVFDPDEAGEDMGEGFRGLKLAVPQPAGTDSSGSRKLFYAAALFLVLSVTGYSGYLLHRDSRREAQIGALRAQFVANVSHELKTPITAIRAYAELMEMRAPADEVLSNYVNTILCESDRLSRLVDGVLDFSRMEQGKRLYRFSPVYLGDVIRAALNGLEYPLTQGGFQVRVTGAEQRLSVNADRDALAQAILNLISNAMKYSDESRSIELTLESETDHAIIRVRDYGIGIPFDEQRRIFERFYRAPFADGRLIPGAGLGLTIVDQVVTAHGGKVEVESRPGSGSTFSIRLPIPSHT